MLASPLRIFVNNAFLLFHYNTQKEFNFSNTDKHAIHSAYKATSRHVIVCNFDGNIFIKETAGQYLRRDMSYVLLKAHQSIV